MLFWRTSSICNPAYFETTSVLHTKPSHSEGYEFRLLKVFARRMARAYLPSVAARFSRPNRRSLNLAEIKLNICPMAWKSGSPNALTRALDGIATRRSITNRIFRMGCASHTMTKCKMPKHAPQASPRNMPNTSVRK